MRLLVPRCLQFVIVVFFLSQASALYAVSELRLIDALPIDGPSNNQPSGLTIFSGKLVTVSDKHDDVVFELKLSGDHVEQVPLITLDHSRLVDRSGILDFEGLTTDAKGDLLIVSESHFRTLSVKGTMTQWITPSLRQAGRERGLFKTRGAYFEGLGFSHGKLYLAGEREPRGLVVFDLSEQAAVGYLVNETIFETDTRRSLDFTGITFYEDRMFVLQRNNYLVAELKQVDGKWQEQEGYTFGHVEKERSLRYSNMKYGRAEGLVMDKTHLYIVLDNNNDARANNKRDRRPMLLIFENPIAN